MRLVVMDDVKYIEKDGLIYAPLDTEVLERYHDIVIGTSYDQVMGLCVHLDIRKMPWKKLLHLPPRTRVGWADVRTIAIKELSCLRRPITYQLTYGDGWYRVTGGERCYFAIQPHLAGIDLQRGCTTVAIRAAVMLSVLSGVGLRAVTWMMSLLFHFTVCKSSLDRWIIECSEALPNPEEIVKLLNRLNPVRELHLDEIFPKGCRPKHCMLVLRDQLGRLLLVRRLEERTEAAVTEVLTEFKSWGMNIETFYVDGCDAYKKAIINVYPSARIQYDYFHIIQCVFKKLWKSVVIRRRDIKARSKKVTSVYYARRLSSLALRIWENRWLFFKRDDNLTKEELETLNDLIEKDAHLCKVRSFAEAVWSLFEDSRSEPEAREALEQLKRRSEVKNQTCFKKSVEFLSGRFDDMICHLRDSDVQRNSLAETGMRFLRRLEQGHDGFRSDEGLDRHVRLYQAIRYLNWRVHDAGGSLGFAHTTGTAETSR